MCTARAAPHIGPPFSGISEPLPRVNPTALDPRSRGSDENPRAFSGDPNNERGPRMVTGLLPRVNVPCYAEGSFPITLNDGDA